VNAQNPAPLFIIHHQSPRTPRYARVTNGQLEMLQEVKVSGHKFKIGQLVNYLIRGGSLGVYQVTQLLPPEGEAFQYRIKNANEPHERVVKEHELRSAA
jgi:hypothetical protein